MEGYDRLRYNNIVIATDADVDGMHIRLLLMTFFLQFSPTLLKMGMFIFWKPRYLEWSKQETIYCYNEERKTGRYKKAGAISPKLLKAWAEQAR
ncbi:MAG: toprim domain-containing protein [Ferruginibacter sp.]